MEKISDFTVLLPDTGYPEQTHAAARPISGLCFLILREKPKARGPIQIGVLSSLTSEGWHDFSTVAEAVRPWAGADQLLVTVVTDNTCCGNTQPKIKS